MELWDDYSVGQRPIDIPTPRSPARWLRLELIAALILTDIIAISGAFAFAWIMSGNANSLSQFTAISSGFLGTYICCAVFGRAFNHEVVEFVSKSMNRSMAAVIGAIVVTTLILGLSDYVAAEQFRKLGLIAALILGSIFVGRMIFEKLLSQYYKTSLFDRVLIMDGDPVSIPDGFRCIRARERGIEPNSHDPMMRHWAALYLAGADRVVVACRPERYLLWARFLKGSGVPVEILMPELDLFDPTLVGRHEASTTIGISRHSLSAQDRVLKRCFDLILSLVLLIIFAPIMLASALLVKLGDGGPILFTQHRMGRGNQLFRVLKFRTMTMSLGSNQKPTVTRVGRILRSLSIDELPQLLNVLSGQMSLVGPRPHALESHAENHLFWEVDEKYWHRHAIKPGITGLAQVRGFRGATLKRADLTNRLQSDLEYLSGWSIWRDLAILISTVRVMVHKNAY